VGRYAAELEAAHGSDWWKHFDLRDTQIGAIAREYDSPSRQEREALSILHDGKSVRLMFLKSVVVFRPDAGNVSSISGNWSE